MKKSLLLWMGISPIVAFSPDGSPDISYGNDSVVEPSINGEAE